MKGIQCKNIPTGPVLKFLQLKTARGESCTWFSYSNEEPFADSVAHAMPVGTPIKLVLAKIRNLVNRGWVDGCPCGCRGSFTITGAGLDELCRLETEETGREDRDLLE